MSYQTTTVTADVGKAVQVFIDKGYEEILIQADEDEAGYWTITADRRKFWGWLATPDEMAMLQSHARELKALANMHPTMAPVFQLLRRAAFGELHDEG